MKRLFFLACGFVFLVSCAAQTPDPVIDPNCAITAPDNGETDGGYGGTGNTAECASTAAE